MNRDNGKQKSNHKVGGIALGVCLGTLLIVGIEMYSVNHERQSTLAQDDTFFTASNLAVEKQKDSNLLQNVANWTQDGISSMTKKEQKTTETEKSVEEETLTETATEAASEVTDASSEIDVSDENVTSDQNSETDTADIPDKAEDTQQYLVLGNLNVNVRQQPSLNGAKVGMLTPGSKVTVDKKENDWYHITGETPGYVIATALQKINEKE